MNELLIGCDTLVATGSATSDGSVLFAKNSDRHPDECRHLVNFAAAEYPAGTKVRTQYLTIPQARRTFRVMGGQPFWLWGFEDGVNEKGVAIGNEAIWTKAARQEIGLLGMDLARLGLERGETAREALEVITALIAEHGQGGSPRHFDAAAPCYDNSFILADTKEAWILETSGRDWAAKRVAGVSSISNVPTLGTDFELASPALRNRPGLDFGRDLTAWETHPHESGKIRCSRSRALLESRAGKLTPQDMMAFLRDHGDDPNWLPGEPEPRTICVHPPKAITAGSLVAQLMPGEMRTWWAFGPPCCSPFLPLFIEGSVPTLLAKGEAKFAKGSLWWAQRRRLDWLEQDWADLAPSFQEKVLRWEAHALWTSAHYVERDAASKSQWARQVSSGWYDVLETTNELTPNV